VAGQITVYLITLAVVYRTVAWHVVSENSVWVFGVVVIGRGPAAGGFCTKIYTCIKRWIDTCARVSLAFLFVLGYSAAAAYYMMCTVVRQPAQA
jgi:hypothetical protein